MAMRGEGKKNEGRGEGEERPPLEKLRALLSGLGRAAVAYSGGADSAFLLRAALDALGPADVLALIADSPALPRRELAAALRLAAEMGARCLRIETDELDDPAYAANPPDRCYHCKKRIFSLLAAAARKEGFPILLDGDQADDAREDRPGGAAARELGVRSPLLECGLGKAEVRAASRALGLPTADKPAQACLATRIRPGTPVTRERLARIERAEDLLHDAGFPACRVRDRGELARIELPPGRIADLAAPEARVPIAAGLRRLGYRIVTLDIGRG